MRQSADEVLIMAAAHMSRAAPDHWKNFLGALDLRATTVRDRCVQSDLPALQVNQGKAQECAALIALLKDVAASADRIVAKRG